MPVKTIATSDFVGDGDHLAVTHGSSGLDDRGRAGFDRRNQTVGERKEGVGGGDRTPREGLGQARHLSGFLGLVRAETRGIDPRHLARSDAHRRAVLGVDDGVRLHMLGDRPCES